MYLANYITYLVHLSTAPITNYPGLMQVNACGAFVCFKNKSIIIINQNETISFCCDVTACLIIENNL